MVMSDKWIRRWAEDHGMIEPFEPEQVRDGNISYGLSSFGYDIRVAKEWGIFTNLFTREVNPKSFDPSAIVEEEDDDILIPANSFALAKSVERFKIPPHVLALCVGKSTYARCGIIVNVTPLEPGWEGVLTIEISNTTPLPARIFGGEGIAQLIFLQGSGHPGVTYADRDGKYQGQTGITLPKL